MKFQEYIANLYEADKEIEFRRIDEEGAGLNRVMKSLKNSDLDFSIITAFRKFDNSGKPLELKEKQARNNSLLRDLRNILGNQKAYGAYRFIGHWRECSKVLPDDAELGDCVELGGKLEDVMEETWCILNDQKNPEFLNALLEVAKKYDQDSFIARINGKISLYSKSGKILQGFKTIDDDILKRGLAAVLNVPGYSELRKIRARGRIETMVIQDESFDVYLTIPDGNIASHRLYNSMNILWK